MNEVRVMHIGIAPRGYVKQRMIAIAKGGPVRAGEPKHWVSSLESLAKVLSEENMLLLEMIRHSKPESLTELAKLSGRAKSNLSRTIQTMESLGLIEISVAQHGKKIPTVAYDKLKFEYELHPARPKTA